MRGDLYPRRLYAFLALLIWHLSSGVHLAKSMGPVSHPKDGKISVWKIRGMAINEEKM
jgi:hypothetical protein